MDTASARSMSLQTWGQRGRSGVRGQHPCRCDRSHPSNRCIERAECRGPCGGARLGSTGGRAHINAAYFAWDRTFAIVWLSAPGARHSRNLQRNASAAIVVYDSTQRWGRRDRGIHLYGSARELRGTQRARPHASINDASRTTTSPTSTHTTPGT
ncbi:MAG: pyridoxamine 5'-phosphate oxidase family protein [Chloroflexi bacterium]|nr:MAG: pyridoxamine 5'-phosphate oxidase family protein [Chloroflexota bacterium]